MWVRFNFMVSKKFKRRLRERSYEESQAAEKQISMARVLKRAFRFYCKNVSVK